MSDTCHATSSEAEKAFYSAFERADVDEMMRVWADEDTVFCIHPMGPRLEGREAVAQSWRQIFAAGTNIRFELTEVSCTLDGNLAVHCVYENIRHGPRLDQRSRVLATNIYASTDRGWRMIAHHASPGVSESAVAQEPHSTLH